MKRFLLSTLCGLTMLINATAWGLPLVDISYTGSKSGNHYTFDFTVKNNSTTDALDFFLISLDADTYSLYTNVAWGDNKGWSSNAFQYDPAFGMTPAAVTADDSTAFGSGGGGIDPGLSLGGFKVAFDYAGSLAIDKQQFSYLADFGTYLVNPNNPDEGYGFAAEETGIASYETSTVPEPGTIVLLSLGLAGLGIYARRRVK